MGAVRAEGDVVTDDDTVWEYGFAAPITGLMYVTTNDMLAETMHRARPEVTLYRRPLTEWTEVHDHDIEH